MNNKVNIVIVNYNCSEDTLSCIESLLYSTYKNYHIYIVDNNSNDKSIDNIIQWTKDNNVRLDIFNNETFKKQKNVQPLVLPKITLIKSDTNGGFAYANNIVLDYLTNYANKNEYVWMLNPDTIVEKNVMLELLQIGLRKEKVIVGNIIYYFNQPEKILFCGGFKINKMLHGITQITNCYQIKDLEVITGSSLFTSINTFNELGLFPKDYFMYWEETDFCTNAIRKGYTFDVNTKSKIFDHVGSVSNSNFLREYLYLLNGLRFYKKYYPSKIVIIYISTIIKLFKALLFENTIKKRALYYAHIDFISELFGKKINVKKRL